MRNTAFTARTAVPLGSVTKVATATAVLLLADDGDLIWTNPSATSCPTYPASQPM
ncbi:beta-lactamase family protein [Streptomyces albogriseolus]|nr:beta-lactamase family protein [Streptomyces albogriseolus]